MWQSINWDAFVVLSFEYVTFITAINKAALQLQNISIKLLGLEHFVWKCCKSEVEKVA